MPLKKVPFKKRFIANSPSETLSTKHKICVKGTTINYSRAQINFMASFIDSRLNLKHHKVQLFNISVRQNTSNIFCDVTKV